MTTRHLTTCGICQRTFKTEAGHQWHKANMHPGLAVAPELVAYDEFQQMVRDDYKALYWYERAVADTHISQVCPGCGMVREDGQEACPDCTAQDLRHRGQPRVRDAYHDARRQDMGALRRKGQRITRKELAHAWQTT